MGAVKEEINWSAVACRAFEDNLAEIATKKEEKEMADVIQRLRASKQRGADALYRQGEEDGRRFAAEDAEYDELKKLEQFRQRSAGREWEKFFEKEPTGGPSDFEFGPSENLLSVLRPVLDGWSIRSELGGWHGACAAFWKRFVGEDDSKTWNPSYVRGFAEGVLALWSEIKDHL
jgi:hypothetical protein